jgi:hypothetical protein
MKWLDCTNNAARAASRIENDAVIRFDHIHDCLHDRGRRKELAAIMRALFRELGEEVFVERPNRRLSALFQRPDSNFSSPLSAIITLQPLNYFHRWLDCGSPKGHMPGASGSSTISFQSSP